MHRQVIIVHKIHHIIYQILKLSEQNCVLIIDFKIASLCVSAAMTVDGVTPLDCKGFQKVVRNLYICIFT